ncbi:uncharacterized protein LOC135830311 [Sycon ciliatum]|uniref:uncharacterized protein LOC135830311 n=1 Tax=Sycon ciliatum TaxID=27933 RepID=UPI0031F6988A
MAARKPSTSTRGSRPAEAGGAHRSAGSGIPHLPHIQHTARTTVDRSGGGDPSETKQRPLGPKTHTGEHRGEKRARYSGDMKDGQRDGSGEQIYNKVGDHFYRGTWKSNVYHGVGELCGPDGYRYYGKWRKGSRHGPGLEKRGNTVYDGEWRNDTPMGSGSLVWNGLKFEGRFVNGVMHGRGRATVHERQTSVVFEGNFTNGDLSAEMPVSMDVVLAKDLKHLNITSIKTDESFTVVVLLKDRYGRLAASESGRKLSIKASWMNASEAPKEYFLTDFKSKLRPFEDCIPYMRQKLYDDRGKGKYIDGLGMPVPPDFSCDRTRKLVEGLANESTAPENEDNSSSWRFTGLTKIHPDVDDRGARETSYAVRDGIWDAYMRSEINRRRLPEDRGRSFAQSRYGGEEMTAHLPGMALDAAGIGKQVDPTEVVYHEPETEWSASPCKLVQVDKADVQFVRTQEVFHPNETGPQFCNDDDGGDVLKTISKRQLREQTFDLATKPLAQVEQEKQTERECERQEQEEQRERERRQQSLQEQQQSEGDGSPNETDMGGEEADQKGGSDEDSAVKTGAAASEHTREEDLPLSPLALPPFLYGVNFPDRKLLVEAELKANTDLIKLIRDIASRPGVADVGTSEGAAVFTRLFVAPRPMDLSHDALALTMQERAAQAFEATCDMYVMGKLPEQHQGYLLRGNSPDEWCAPSIADWKLALPRLPPDAQAKVIRYLRGRAAQGYERLAVPVGDGIVGEQLPHDTDEDVQQVLPRGPVVPWISRSGNMQLLHKDQLLCRPGVLKITVSDATDPEDLPYGHKAELLPSVTKYLKVDTAQEGLELQRSKGVIIDSDEEILLTMENSGSASGPDIEANLALATQRRLERVKKTRRLVVRPELQWLTEPMKWEYKPQARESM